MNPCTFSPIVLGAVTLFISVQLLYPAIFNIADGDVAGLKAAMTTAATNQQSDVINLAANGTYTLTTVDNINTGENGLPLMGHDRLVFGTDITIHGNGATVQRASADGTPVFRIFNVVGGNIILQDLVIKNGVGRQIGGGILSTSTGTVTLLNCTFTQDNAVDDGGCVSNSNTGTVTLTNCVLTNNIFTPYGAGILNEFTGTVNVNSSTLTANVATAAGGAIYNFFSGTVNISNSTLASNSAGGSIRGGGAIYNDSGTITITQSNLNSNGASADGGAIYSPAGQITLTDTTFNGNGATRGGAVIILGGSLSISNCKFIGNGASGAGGAIFNAGSAAIDVSSFSSNTITTSVDLVSADPTGSVVNGGAISNSGASATITLTNCTLINNSAAVFGAGTVYGIGIYNDGGTVMLTDSALETNTATFYHDLEGNSYGNIVFQGGGVFNNGSGEVNLNRCTLSTNFLPVGGIASSEGGGILNNGAGSVNVLNSTLAFNTANFGGGIWNNANGAINLLYSTVAHNSAGSAGGISNVSGPFSVKSTIVAFNSATGSDPDVSGNFTSNGFNLISVDQNNGFNLLTDKKGGPGAALDPQFDFNDLADNGGPTKTLGLLSNSPAINSGDPNAPPLDQRGYLRSGTPDIGAFEFKGSPIRFTSIKRLGNGHILLQGIGVPNGQHTVKMYPDLNATSDAFAPVTANGTGALQYDDAGAVGLTKRFYRLSFP
jgi:fibronectin-binding autotransporter adhesin